MGFAAENLYRVICVICVLVRRQQNQQKKTTKTTNQDGQKGRMPTECVNYLNIILEMSVDKIWRRMRARKTKRGRKIF